MQDTITTLRVSLPGQRGKEKCQSQLLKKALLGLHCKEQGETAKGKDDGDEQNTRETENKMEHSLWVITEVYFP